MVDKPSIASLCGVRVLTHLSLFSGIGGFDIAAEWAGFKTVCFVEIDPFCQKVLRKHWPDVPLIEDIKDVTKEKIMAYAESARWPSWTSKGFIGRCGEVAGNGRNNGEPTVDLITAGVPCQPISVAGKRRGEEDDRWLWPETIRVLSEVRPAWACFENPAGILTMGFDNLLSQMEECGYETQAFIVPACAVNAPHRRHRVWIVAYNECLGWNEGVISQTVQPTEQEPKGQNLEQLCKVVANTEGESSPWSDNTDIGRARQVQSGGISGESRGLDQWAVEPDVGRVAHGVPDRVDRLKALGNAVVPQCAYPILKAIADTYSQPMWGKE